MIREYENSTLGRQKKIIRHIAENLSKQNIEEARLIAGQGASPLMLIAQCAENSETGFVLFDGDGDPHGIGGIAKDRSIWFVLTEDHTQAMRVSWLKNGRRWFERQLDKYGAIHGYCWEKNELSMKWMRWFGFDFTAPDSEATQIINDEKFLYFQKNK